MIQCVLVSLIRPEEDSSGVRSGFDDRKLKNTLGFFFVKTQDCNSVRVPISCFLQPISVPTTSRALSTGIMWTDMSGFHGFNKGPPVRYPTRLLTLQYVH